MHDAIKLKTQGTLKSLEKEFVVLLLADGFDKLSREFLQNMNYLQVFNEDILIQRGYIEYDSFTGKKVLRE